MSEYIVLPPKGALSSYNGIQPPSNIRIKLILGLCMTNNDTAFFSVSRFYLKKKKLTYRPFWFSGHKDKQTFYVLGLKSRNKVIAQIYQYSVHKGGQY